MFSCYVAVALLEHFKQEILIDDTILIPQKILAIRLTKLSEVIDIIRRARVMKNNMPYSLHAKLIRYDVFKLNTIDSILSTLNKETCLSVHARELIQRTFPEAQLCSNCPPSNCVCFPSKNDINFIVIDCRTEDEQQAGILPNSDLLNIEAYLNEDYLKNIHEIYKEFKGIFHICLMGSKAFKPKEERTDNIDEEEDYVQNMLENLLHIFMINDFPYVSVVEGGFQKIHEFAMHYQLQIEKHNQNMCTVCNPDGVKYNNKIKDSLKKIGSKLFGRVRAFAHTIKNIVRNPPDEEFKIETRKALSRRQSVEHINNFNDFHK